MGRACVRPSSIRCVRLLTTAALLALALTAIAAPAVYATTISVTTTTDELNNDGDCSLREAVRASALNVAVDKCRAGSATDLITLQADVYPLTLPGDDDNGVTGDLDLFGTLTISGWDANHTFIDGSGIDRVIDVRPGARVVLNRLALRNGAVADGGGGVRNFQNLTLTNCAISGNDGGTNAGGLYNAPDATASISNCVISQNQSDSGAGGIQNGGSLTLSNTTVDGNASTDGAGGIANDGTLTMISGAISNNEAVSPVAAGGLRNTGTLTVNHTSIRFNFVAAGNGGGVWNLLDGVANLSAVTISDNTTLGSGGGVYNSSGSVTISESAIVNNAASSNAGAASNGGGIWNAGTLTLSRSTVGNNRASVFNIQIEGGGYGGGIYNEGTLYVNRSTISNNLARNQNGFWGNTSEGGGVYNRGSFIMRNSTITSNHVVNGRGGGLANAGEGSGTFSSLTIARNTADIDGGGVYDVGGEIRFWNTLIAINTLGDPGANPNDDLSDCSGFLTSRGYNLLQNPNGCVVLGVTTGNLSGVDPKLGGLANNGGTTLTRALLSGSPAIDAGNPSAAGSTSTSCEAIDQRGTARPRDGNADGVARCDIGAYEK